MKRKATATPVRARRRRGLIGSGRRCAGRQRRLRRRDQGADPAAATRGHHPPAGGRKGSRRLADRRRHLLGVQVQRPDVHAGARGLMQITPDAAEVHRAPERRNHLQARRSRRPRNQHPLRDLPPARTARTLRRRRGRGAGRLQRRAGQRRRVGWGALTVATIPFPETRAYVEEVLEKRDEYRDEYAQELGYAAIPLAPASPPWRWRSASSSPTPRSSSWHCRRSTANWTPASPASPGC